MSLYGPDLRLYTKNQFLQRSEELWTIENKVKDLGLKMLKWIQQLHSLGYVHCDIKPENFVFNLPESSESSISTQKKLSPKDFVIMIDFGMVHSYVDKSRKNNHIAYEQTDFLKGTASFSSISSLKGFQQSRRDDIESFVYVLLYMLHGHLPWQKYRTIEDYDKRIDKIIESKLDIFNSDLIKNTPECFLKVLKYWRSLRFSEVPNYSYIESLLWASSPLQSISKISPVKPLTSRLKDQRFLVSAKIRKYETKPATVSERKFTEKEESKHSGEKNSSSDHSFIKSFSFLKNRSQIKCVMSKFKSSNIVSHKSSNRAGHVAPPLRQVYSFEEESEESESSVSENSLYKPYKHKLSNINEKTGNLTSLFSGINGTKIGDSSPGGASLMNRISNLDIRKPSQDDLSNECKIGSLNQLNSKGNNIVKISNTSLKSLFYGNINTQKQNIVPINLEISEDIAEENATSSENINTSELSELGTFDQPDTERMAQPWSLFMDSKYTFHTNQNSNMFKSKTAVMNLLNQ